MLAPMTFRKPEHPEMAAMPAALHFFIAIRPLHG
jgi:hypothetical protein